MSIPNSPEHFSAMIPIIILFLHFVYTFNNMPNVLAFTLPCDEQDTILTIAIPCIRR